MGTQGDTVLMTSYREVFGGLEGAGAMLGGAQSNPFFSAGTCGMRCWSMVSPTCSLLCTPNGCGVAQKAPPGSPQLPLLSSPLPELTVADRRQKREIRQLEQELHKWQVLVDSITGERWGGPVSICLSPQPSVCPFTLFSPTPARHEFPRFRQPDAGCAAGPHGAVPHALP